LVSWLVGDTVSTAQVFIGWAEWLVLIRGLVGIVDITRRFTAHGWNPALLLVVSFLVLIAVGTLLLMLPRARADATAGAPFLTALFTSTSASCVTGLIVEPTGTYWSRFGQTIILVLFQVGGLGIMTCGAFFAVLTGAQMRFRESATLRDLLDSDGLGNVRQLLRTIVTFTLIAELVGALFLSGLWSDQPFFEQAYQSIFHSVSAFCNAGFSLTVTDDSFTPLANRWQTLGVLPVLIIAGGLGFAVTYNVGLAAHTRIRTLRTPPLFRLPRDRVRLTVSTKLVLITSAALLVMGMIGYYLLESTSSEPTRTPASLLGEAWFQSVTFRTAGFNTVDLGELQPATKLFAVLLMFIGASPGSTGGGVKTICFALAVVAVLSFLRGRDRVEVMGRTIPMRHVNRALTMIAVGMVTLMSTTLLVVLFEQKPALFLDHLFESASAFGTVGVSTGITAKLTAPSKMVIVVAMLLGRVGPLTLLLALAGREDEARYEYPSERIPLG
jgi:trk system potassium uptake protein TrkH